MKSYQVWGSAVPLFFSALVACGGESSIGSGGESGMNAGGGKLTGTAAAAARAGTDDGSAANTGTGGHGAVSVGGGKATPGSGAAPTDGSCMGDTDCLDEPCQMCEDGSVRCKKTYCAGNKCRSDNVNPCPVPCTDGMECNGLGNASCVDCGNGTQSCPTGTCVEGYCEINLKGCELTDPCKGQACGAVCDSCGTGGDCDAKEPSYCSRDGKCKPERAVCAGGGDCETTMDCGTPPPMCVPCGGETCASFECIESKCVFACPAGTSPECNVSEDCPSIGEICKECSNGKCAVQACLQGSCELVCPFE